jgi:hypothetical protein
MHLRRNNAVMGLRTCMGWTEPCTPAMWALRGMIDGMSYGRGHRRTSWGAWWEDKIIIG